MLGEEKRRTESRWQNSFLRSEIFEDGFMLRGKSQLEQKEWIISGESLGEVGEGRMLIMGSEINFGWGKGDPIT